MNQDLETSVLNAGKQAVIAVAGGGSGALSRLLKIPGASGTVLEAIAPQAPASLAGWIGGSPDGACNEATARAMAMAAWRRAALLSSGDGRDLVGVGSTASLVTDRPKRGEHRVHVATQTADSTAVLSLVLKKGKRDRAAEEEVVERAVLAMAADAMGALPIDVQKSPPGIEAELSRANAREDWRSLLLGDSRCTPRPRTPGEAPKLLIPGSFNPFHEGHARIAEVAAERTGFPAVFELSITNVDKPPLDYLEIERRLNGLKGREVFLTAAPTFLEKSQLAPGCVFAVGVDTIERLADAKYCGGDMVARSQQYAEMNAYGCRFLVFGRKEGEGFLTLADLTLPHDLAELCEGVDEKDFRFDVSSTELRALHS